MTDTRAPMTIRQQADLLDHFANRCAMRDGSVAGEALLYLEPNDVADLRAIAMRLHRMAPHEREIRRVVTGK